MFWIIRAKLWCSESDEYLQSSIYIQFVLAKNLVWHQCVNFPVQKVVKVCFHQLCHISWNTWDFTVSSNNTCHHHLLVDDITAGTDEKRGKPHHTYLMQFVKSILPWWVTLAWGEERPNLHPCPKEIKSNEHSARFVFQESRAKITAGKEILWVVL